MVSIIDWYSNGAQRENDHDIIYLTTPGEEITFSVTTDEPCDYSWEINKVEQGINSSGIIFTVPSLNCSQNPSKCIWEIHVKAYNADGEDHMEWVVSTVNPSEAPDIFDYFIDKKKRMKQATSMEVRYHTLQKRPWGYELQTTFIDADKNEHNVVLLFRSDGEPTDEQIKEQTNFWLKKLRDEITNPPIEGSE